MDVPQLQESLRSGGQNLLDSRAEELRAAGLTVEVDLLEIWGGQIARSLVDAGEKWQAELLVMGTHGYGGLTHLLLGSVAEGVLRHTKTPVLLVRAPQNDA